MLWRDAETGRVIRDLGVDGDNVGQLPDSEKYLFLGGRIRRSQLVDAATGTARGPALKHTHIEGVSAAAFSGEWQ